MLTIVPSPNADLRSVWNVFGAVSDEADGFHTGVWEGCITGELGQTLNSILEGVDGGCKVLFKHICWEGERERKDRAEMVKKKKKDGLKTDDHEINITWL